MTFNLDATKVAHPAHAERLRAFLAGEKVAPLTIDMALTQKCQMACRFCYAGLQRHDADPVPWVIWERFLEDCTAIGHGPGEGVKAVSLVSDGESTLSKSYYRFIYKARELGIDVASGTNGEGTKPPQLILTSGGLGEMGCGLPYAVGAAFAGRPVVALLTDGGMMLNLQELQTIRHHNLAVKMFIFDNRGYSMIRHTQKNLGYPYRGTDKASGVSMPDFVRVAESFGFRSANITAERQWNITLPVIMNAGDAAVCVVRIDPEQRFWPKLEPIVEDGKTRSPRFDELTPL